MISKAEKSDIAWMVRLSRDKREAYSKAQKQFWKMTENSDEIQTKWFEELLRKDNIIALVADSQKGFVIGEIITPPEVYDAGPTLKIDDFCVKFPDMWNSVGFALLSEIKLLARNKGATQILVVSGAHDKEKYNFLTIQNLSIASEWFVANI